MDDRLTALHEIAGRRGLRIVDRIGEGLEFTAFRAVGSSGDQVVLRMVRGGRRQTNANDLDVDTRVMMAWSHQVTGWLAPLGIPVPAPLELVHAPNDAPDQPDVLISGYVADDGGDVDGRRLGELLAALHRLRPTTLRPPMAAGRPATDVVRERLLRRWATAAALSPDLPPTPTERELGDLIAHRPPGGSLLHLDVRRPNLRCVDGRVLALLDWSNALIGDPLLELGRLTEFARLPDNGLDLNAIRRGYRDGGGDWPEQDPALLLYQLDAAVMLVLVFLAEAPDPTRGRQAVERLDELHAALRSRV